MEILYFVAGMFFQRILIIFAVKNIAPGICDYCRYLTSHNKK
jgi:hypothetical protein